MNVELERFDADWLALREPADARARSVDPLDPLRDHLSDATRTAGSRLGPMRPAGPALLEVLDLGSGTGATTRWLAPRLDGPQHWVLLDHDPDLLAVAAQRCAYVRDAAGGPVATSTRTADLTDLSAHDVAGTALITGSALLDVLTRSEVDALAALCAAAGCAALFTLSVAGSVALDPPDPMDREIAAAFDAHQRRTAGTRRLLGPDAVAATSSAFGRRGFEVSLADSPWRLGNGSPGSQGSSALMRAWLDGWLAAAESQHPVLGAGLADYRRRREEDIASGRLRVDVGHHDLLALPRPSPQTIT